MTAPTPDLNALIAEIKGMKFAHDAQNHGDPVSQYVHGTEADRYGRVLDALAAVTADLNASIQMHEQARSLLDQTLTERDQARQMLADAPHTPDCKFGSHFNDCDCWKAGL